MKNTPRLKDRQIIIIFIVFFVLVLLIGALSPMIKQIFDNRQLPVSQPPLVSLTLTLHPKEENFSSAIAYIDLKMENHSGFVLERIDLDLSATPSGSIKATLDNNHDRSLSSSDSSLGTFLYRDWKPNKKQVKMRLKTQTNLQSGHQRIFLSSTGNIGENIKNIDVKILSSEGEKINLRPTRLVDDRVFRYQDKIFQPMEEFLNDYPMFKKDKNSKNAQGIILPQGKYNFSQTLIVPSTVELAIEPGTTIQLAPKTSILSYAKVIAQGTSSQPITLTSKSGQPWGVFAIVGKHASGTQLNYLVVENGSEDYLNGIYFTGALAVHYAHVTIASSIFRFNSGDDGLNIKHANATLDDNTFTRNQNDGLDLDVVTGQVSGNLFYQNGNDGLDISFSDVSITGNEFIENSDKCLSIGEKSTPNIVNNSFTRCDTAIAVKDLSRALITKNQFLSNDTAISAFQKKLIFGGATVTLDQNEFKDNHVDFDINPNSTLEYADSK